VKSGGFELGKLCKQQGAIDNGRIGLSDVCSQVLHCYLPKDEDIRTSDWDSENLTDEQKNYAALDAWAGLLIYDSVQNLGSIGKEISRSVNAGIYKYSNFNRIN
jgi:hypothetical protein